MGNSIEFTRDGGAAGIAFNRPDKLNSFDRAMHADLRDALCLCEQDDTVRAVVLTGNGRAFCAGQDLSDLSFEPGSLTDLGTLIDENFNPLVRRLQTLLKSVIASVQGIAAGAGANVALACDPVIAGRSASFVQAFVNIGLVPDSRGTHLLAQRVGIARAMDLAMLGEKLHAETAAAWGLIWEGVDDAKLDAKLDARVDALAKRRAAMPTRALAASKLAIQSGGTRSLSAQFALERDLQAQLGASHDYSEGVNAFFQKRAPRFEGR